MTPPNEQSKFDLYLKLVSLLTLPITIIIILIIFWKPIMLLSNKVPAVLEKSETITIAGITLKTSGEIKEKPTPRINAALTGLKKDAILTMLENGVDEPSIATFLKFDAKTYDSIIVELVERGLMRTIRVPQQDTNTNPQGNCLVKMTKLGVSSSLILKDVFSAFTKELAKPKEENQETKPE